MKAHMKLLVVLAVVIAAGLVYVFLADADGVESVVFRTWLVVSMCLYAMRLKRDINESTDHVIMTWLMAVHLIAIIALVGSWNGVVVTALKTVLILAVIGCALAATILRLGDYPRDKEEALERLSWSGLVPDFWGVVYQPTGLASWIRRNEFRAIGPFVSKYEADCAKRRAGFKPTQRAKSVYYHPDSAPQSQSALSSCA